jgi:membrane protease YdiL (CAAX protease family)
MVITMQQHSTPQTTENDLSAALRGWGIVGTLFTIVVLLMGNMILPNMIVLPVGALLVLIWIRITATPWHEIGYVKPKSWIAVVVTGLVLGITFKFGMKAVVMPLFGADPVNQAYHFLAGNKELLPAAIFGMLVAGFGEETVFRGFLFTRLKRLFGCSNRSRILIVILTSALFASGHYTQGMAGIEQAAITGLVFGSIYAVTGSIWMIMVAHAAFDLTALAIIYWDLETSVAQLIFKG